MKPYQDLHVTVYNKSCHDMSELPDNSIHCVVTSPPYWGLRKYSGEQEITWPDGDVSAFGLEKNIELYVQHTIEILREIKRVLRPDGCCFWNIADTYFGKNWRESPAAGSKQATNRGAIGGDYEINQLKAWKKHDVLKSKDLCLIPFRVAIAAQQDGWWVRSDIAWVKGNPMPESCLDRPTDTWEHVFMFTKSERYFFDMEAVKEISTTFDRELERQPHFFGGNKGKELREQGIRTQGSEYTPVSSRHLRNVWNINTQPYPKSHFAVFPERLPETCIKAATSEAGCCPKCGKQWERIIERKAYRFNPSTTYTALTPGNHNGEGKSTLHTNNGDVVSKTLGWRPACKCDAGPAIPATVLDPFCGSGTTLQVATRLGRYSIGYEISAEYMDLIVDRNRQQGLIPVTPAYQKKLEE